MRQLRFFQRLGPIGTLNLVYLFGSAESFLPALARGEEFGAPPEDLLFFVWLIISGFCFRLAYHFIYVDGSSATGKTPALRAGCRKWFMGYSVLQLALSLLVIGWLVALGQFGWLAAEVVLAFLKLQMILRGNRLFHPCGERSCS